MFLLKELSDTDIYKVDTKTAAEESHIQQGGDPCGKSGAKQPCENSGEGGFAVDETVFDMGGKGGGGGGEKVEEIDSLSQMLIHVLKGGHIDEKQCAASDTEAG